MQETPYGIKVTVPLSYSTAVRRTTEALKEQGFGVLTTIDVQQTLKEIEADHIPAITVLNKIDRLADPERAQKALVNFPNAVAISALKGLGISDLLVMVSEQLYETFMPIKVRLPYQQGGLIALFHEQGQVERIEHAIPTVTYPRVIKRVGQSPPQYADE